MKIVIPMLIMLILSGCSGMVYSGIKGAYVDAKVVYSDAKHVVYEIESERERIKQDGLGEAQK